MVRRTGAAGYGRHAAPLSDYGPSDVHRLLPVSPTGSRAPQPADSGDAPAQTGDPAGHAQDITADGIGTDDPPSGEASMKSTGFWARLRLLPRTA